MLRPARLAGALLALAAALSACGGGGGGSTGGTAPTPSPPVSGPAWFGFGRDAQHAAQSAVVTQALNRIAWSTPVDLAPQYQSNGSLLIHYGSPVVTTSNTVIVPVKTGATGGFRLEARAGGNGVLIWSADSDYVLPAHRWVPSFNPVLTATNRVYAPGAGGKLLRRDSADAAAGSVQTEVFYGGQQYLGAPAAFDATVFINTPITADAQGNLFFGFIATGANPAGVVSGIARVGADGVGRWAAATTLAGDATIVKVATNSAPALSPDQGTLYVVVNANPPASGVQAGRLLALDSTTLALKAKVTPTDPGAGTPAWISDDSTASPAVGPDGDVYLGVLETTFGTHNGRGWLLHFDATLGTSRTPGSFGWDDTPSIVPASMVPSYSGPSTYLLAVKYNNYLGAGTGDGLNRLAVLDPKSAQSDAISGRSVMREVLTILGPTFESGASGPVKEWCINTMVVDPATGSVLANSEDGVLYRWDLATNTFSQRIRLTAGLGEAYTPTLVGADGAVYAVNNATLFSIAR